MKSGLPFFLNGKIIEGDRIGRSIGFPTANLLTSSTLPENGVYVANIKWDDNNKYGMIDIGYRPTVSGRELRAEIHIFNFSSDIYGETVQIFILHKLRDEQKFESLLLLKNQLKKDKKTSEEYLKSNGILF